MKTPSRFLRFSCLFLVVCVAGAQQRDTGSLRVIILPAEANLAGAGWILPDGSVQVSGATVGGLAVGQLKVSFAQVDGWTRPEEATVTIASRTVTELSVTYRTAGTPPAISQQPASISVQPGQAFTLTVQASGTGLSYLWFKDGQAISGANAPSFTVASAGASDAANYRVIVSNSSGFVTSRDATVTLGTVAPPATGGRLVNLSVLTSLASASDTFTLGYVVGGAGTSGPKPLLIRAGGPSLAQLGVGGPLPDPRLELFAGTVRTGENDNWGGGAALISAFNRVGAFPFAPATSRDSATVANVTTRDNSVRVSSVGSGAGAVIAEIYEDTPTGGFTAATPRLVNVSVLKNIDAGATLAAGFVVGGSGSRTVLVRAIGPTLGSAPFNIAGAMPDPRLDLFNNSTGARTNENNDWGGSAALTAAFRSVGAFQLSGATSRDAALLVTLTPGQYSARVGSADGRGGVVIVEIYEVP